MAAELNRDWAGTPVRAHFIEDYYRVTQTAYVQALRARGLSDAQIGTHAGVADTSLLMAIDPGMVRTDRLEGSTGQRRDRRTGRPARLDSGLGTGSAST